MAEQHPPSVVPVPDRLEEVLQKAFDFKPLLSTQSPEADQHPYVATLPFEFYDRHLDANLALKHVVSMPSIPKDLASKFDSTLSDLRNRKLGPMPLTTYTRGQSKSALYSRRLGPRVIAPLNMVMRYSNSYGDLIPAFASSWIVHPLTRKYFSTLEFSKRPRKSPDSEVNATSEYSLRFSPFEDHRPEVMSVIDEETKAALKDLEGKDIFTSVFFPMCSQTEEMFRRMDDLIGAIPSPAYTTRGFLRPPQPLNRPCDASKTPWTLPRLPVDELPVKEAQPKEREIKPTLRDEATNEYEEMKIVTAAGLLHHVWNHSVTENTTLIWMTCGNYERFGIRHRASQTLFLTENLAVTDFDEPSYGKVHFGLFFSAVGDALDRHRQAYTPPGPPAPVKRRRGDIPSEGTRRSKRQKAKGTMTMLTKVASTNRDMQSIGKALQSRPLALVSVNFGPFNSPVPAACLRTGGILTGRDVGSNVVTWKPSYQLRDCFELSLNSDLGLGGTGRIHSARLGVETPGGRLNLEVAVKAAVDPMFRKRLRREYSVYQRLWQCGVPNIPVVYGLFEDSDDMVTFLVLQRLSLSFRDREPSNMEGGLLLSVTPRERSTCLSTLRSIHRAGVVHCDLRAENILLASDGTPKIIDFDHASLDPEPSEMEVEFNGFRDMLDGKAVGHPIFFQTPSDDS